MMAACITVAAASDSLALPKCGAGDTCSVTASVAATTYNFTAATTVTGNYTVTCTCNATANLFMSAGGGGAYTARKMSGATTPKLNYNLLTVSGGKISCTANNVEWADTTAGAYCTLSSPNGSDSGTFTLTIPAGQTVLSGTFSDTIQMTMNYTAGTAQTASTSFTPTATVTGTCTINSGASEIAFGNYAMNSTSDAAGSATVTCTNGSGYKTYITGTRTMTSGANNLAFQIYSDAGRTTVYPADLASGLLGTGTGALQTINYYGRIAPQSVMNGSYSASLILMVEY